jgi:comEA protein
MTAIDASGRHAAFRRVHRKERPVRHLVVSVVAVATAVLVLAAPINASPVQEKSPQAKAAPAQIVNINTAPADQLERLPGVGPKTAARIVEYRQKNGGFKKVEELMNVRGIGEKAFLKMKGQLTVTAVKPEQQ